MSQVDWSEPVEQTVGAPDDREVDSSENGVEKKTTAGPGVKTADVVFASGEADTQSGRNQPLHTELTLVEERLEELTTETSGTKEEDHTGQTAEATDQDDTADATDTDISDTETSAKKSDTTANNEDPARLNGEKSEDYKNGTLEASGPGYKITLDYKADAKIPENAYLKVSEITRESDPEAYEACLKEAGKTIPADGKGTSAVDDKASRFFDIEILVDELAFKEDAEENLHVNEQKNTATENENAESDETQTTTRKIEPAAPVSVNIQLFDTEISQKPEEFNAEQYKVVHIAEDKTEEIQDVKAQTIELEKKDVSPASTEKESDSDTTAVAPATEVQFEAESFSIYGVVYTVDFHTEVISANGDKYEVTVRYGEDAKIPEGAELRVREILPEDDEYKAVQEKAGKELAEEMIEAIPAHPVLFDIAIYDGETEIEPAEGSSVEVEIKLVKDSVAGIYSDENSPVLINDEPVKEDEQTITQNLKVIHDVKDGTLDVVDILEKNDEETVAGQFSTESFSNWLVFLDQDVEEITVGRGDTITLRPYSQWVWNQQNVVDGESVSWKYPDTAGHMTVETKHYKDQQLNQEYDLYHLTATSNPGDFYIETTAGKKIHVIVQANPVSDTPGTVDGLDTIKVNLFNYDLDHSLDVWMNTASYIDANRNGQYTHYNGDGNWGTTTDYNRSPFTNDGINAGSALKFLGWGANNGGNRINNYDATNVTTGIVQNKLVSGTGNNADKKYPALNGNGNTSLQYLFTAGTDIEDHMGVTGLFRQDEDGYYYFNSNTNYAIYNADNTFTLYEHTYTQATTKNNTSGQDETSKPIGFFPFHPYDSNNNLSPNHDSALDHHFGLSMEVKFALPPDKKLHKADGTTENITFEFSGDDDMWVFVDDNLTLDMGGIHQPLTGSIDFTNDSRFQGGQEYTLRVFYLERGGCDSNCSIRFNIPLTKRNFEFEKQDANDKNTFIQGAKFQLFRDVACTQPAVNDTNGEYYYGTSGPDGKVHFLTVSIGTYYMKEIEAPAGYRLDETVRLVKLTEDGVTISNIDSNGNTSSCDADPNREGIQIANRKNPDLTVMKQWKDAAGHAITPDNSYSATFKLQRYERHEGDKVIPDTSQPCTFKVFRSRNGESPKQEGSDYTFKGGTTVSVNWGYDNGYIEYDSSRKNKYKNTLEESAFQYKPDNGPAVITLPESGSAAIYINDEDLNTYHDPGVVNITVSGTPYSPSDTTEHVSTEWDKDTDFNNSEDADHFITLPQDAVDSDHPWTGKFSNLTTIEKKGNYTYYYKYYIIETGKTPADSETIYLDGDNNIIGDPSTLKTDESSTQTVINRTLIDIPIEKYWHDYNDGDHTWTAKFQLLYRLIDKTSGDPMTSWEKVNGQQIELTGGNPGHGSFDGLPVYRVVNGTEYRIQYSVAEIEYTVRKLSDNSIVTQWQDSNYFDPAVSTGPKYELHFIQDAGTNGATLNDYSLIVSNILANRKEKKRIDLTLHKTWPTEVDLSEAYANFVLKRIVYEEYRNFDENTSEWVDITLDTGNGTTQTLHVPKNWPMTIFCHIKANTNAESIKFSDVSSPSGILEGAYDNSTENSDHLYYIPFTADQTKTVALTAGEQFVVGGKNGFRLSDINHPTDMEVKEDVGFAVPITLNESNDWQTDLHNLTEIEETEFEGNPFIITRYVYRYYLEETECSPEDYAATFMDSSRELLGDIDHKVDFGSAITAENHLKPGSLKITKNVTVNNLEPSGNTAGLADDTYYFTVTGKEGTPTAGEQSRTVSVVITGGKENTVEVSDLMPGRYIITELDPTNGTSLVGSNSLEAVVEPGKSGNEVSANGIVKMTNNINTTEMMVRKMWADDGQEGVDHSNDQISYTLYRIPYVLGENDEITEYDPEEVQAAHGYNKVLNATTEPKWTNVITGLPTTGGLTIEENGVTIPVRYEYYIAEGTFQGYKQNVSGGFSDGVYSFVINNEPHSTYDLPTEVNVEKEWQKVNGQTDQDGHDNDSITFNLVQKKYEVEIYPVRINLINGDGTRSDLSETIYVPKNCQINFRPESQSNGNSHRVNVSGTNKNGSYLPNKTVYINNANGGRNVTFTLQKENDVWDTQISGSSWRLVKYDDSHGGSVSQNDNIIYEDGLLAWIKTNGRVVNNDHAPYEYTMKLNEDKDGTEILKHSELAIGQPAGNGEEKWVGAVTDLPFYEKAENGKFYGYTYEVTEVKIGYETVASISGNDDFQGQTSQYLVNWEQNPQTGVWEITNRRKPSVNITIKKMNVADLENENPLLPGAAFRLEKFSDATYRVMDSAWTERESADTTNSGIVSFTELPEGYYQLVETAFPEGYVRSGDNPRFCVKQDNGGNLIVVLIDAAGEEMSNEDSEFVKVTNAVLKVGNTPGAALPHTGGPGTRLFTIFGSFLILGAGVLLWRKRRTI